MFTGFLGLCAIALASVAVVAASTSGPTSVVGRTPIGPGTQMETAGAQCTADFVFRDGAGRVYLGYAAHCAGTGRATDVNGCTTPSRPLGTRVRFATGSSSATPGRTLGHGRLRYSSWLTMQHTGTTDDTVCRHNDLALVQVDRAYLRRVDPTVPFWGGPSGLGVVPTTGAQVFTYGSSSLRAGLLSPKAGAVVTSTSWFATLLTLSPGIPGDSGSGFMDADGRAFGTLSTLDLSPVPGTNTVGSLARELRYAQHHGLATVRLVRGDEPFSSTAVF